MQHLIRSASLSGYAEVAQACGLDAAAMLEEFGVAREALVQHELKISAQALSALLDASARRSGVESFGLLMAEKRRLSHLGPLAMLMREQPTKRHALQAMAHYAHRVNPAVSMRLEIDEQTAVLRHKLRIAGHAGVRQCMELLAGIVFLALRDSLGPAWKPRRVCFVHVAPANLDVHRRVFGTLAAFGCDFDGIVCARRDLEARNPKADPILEKYARELVEGCVAQRLHLSDHVRDAIAARIAGGACNIESVARDLDTSRRTMHRALAREGHTFSSLVDQVRRDLAARYVDEGHRPLAEVSELLGFAAPSGFSRWYKRQFSQPASAAGTRATARRSPR